MDQKSLWLDSLLRVSQGWNQAACSSGAWSTPPSSRGCWQNSVPCGCRTESPLSCWPSARGQLLEATCYFLPCGPHHNVAVCPFKANRRAFAATLNLWLLVSDLYSFSKRMVWLGPPSFKVKELYIHRVCTLGTSGIILPTIGRLAELKVSVGGKK